MLLFFYDMIDQSWGFDPADRGGWSVIHQPNGPGATPRQPPESAVDPDDLPDETPLAVAAIQSLPGLERLDMEPDQGSEDKIDEAYDAVRRAPYPSGSRHQVGGYPHAVQNDSMEWNCELIRHGIYCGNGDPYNSPQGQALKPGADAWRLLLQLDTDEEHGMMWGDDGRLFFWIREEDARAGRWEATWMVLQCY